MIYLKVRGGLCNRMRTIDSLISLCEKYKKDLIILWPMDSALNVDFESLFYEPSISKCDFEIIKCPPGYPEHYQFNLKNLAKNFFER